MKTTTLKRLEELEYARQQGDDDPSRIYQALQRLELEAPEPRPGETVKEWLTRVPTAPLESLMARITHGQS